MYGMSNDIITFDLSSSLKVKSNGAVGLSIYDFLLVSNNKYMSNSHHLGVIAAWKFFSYVLSLGPNFDTHPPSPIPTLTPGYFFLFKIKGFPPWVREKAVTTFRLHHDLASHKNRQNC